MNNDNKYLFLGDSVTDCGRDRDIRQPNLPGALGNGWVNRVATELLKQHPEARIWNRGYSGCRISELLDQPGWQPVRGKSQPVFQEITLLIGINDIWHPFNSNEPHDISGAIAAYASVLEKLQPLAGRLTVIEPFAIAGSAVDERWWPLLDDLCRQQEEVAQSRGAHWLSTRAALHQASMARPEHWLYDGVHPGLLGHQWLAERWLTARP